jgi:hypothetical protein
MKVCGALRKGGSGAEAAGDGSKRQDNRANQGVGGAMDGIMIRVTFLRSKPRLEQPEFTLIFFPLHPIFASSVLTLLPIDLLSTLSSPASTIAQ